MHGDFRRVVPVAHLRLPIRADTPRFLTSGEVLVFRSGHGLATVPDHIIAIGAHHPANGPVMAWSSDQATASGAHGNPQTSPSLIATCVNCQDLACSFKEARKTGVWLVLRNCMPNPGNS